MVALQPAREVVPRRRHEGVLAAEVLDDLVRGGLRLGRVGVRLIFFPACRKAFGEGETGNTDLLRCRCFAAEGGFELAVCFYEVLLGLLELLLLLKCQQIFNLEVEIN